MAAHTENLSNEIAGAVTKNRKRLMGFGIVTLILGIIGVYMSVAMTMASILVLGIFIFLAGLAFIIEAFSAPDWKGKLAYILLSLLYIVGGAVIVMNPAASAVWFTLFLAIFFIVIGIFRIIAAFMAKNEVSSWGWILFVGIINIVLGIMIYSQWPVSGLWVIGLFISIELIIRGIDAIILSRQVKKLQNSL